MKKILIVTYYWPPSGGIGVHRCLKFAVEALLVDEGLVDKKVLEVFSYAMDLREGADYGSIYDEDSARFLIDAAERILEGMKSP